MNSISESFVKTFKRDYVRVNPLPDAITALRQIAGWFLDYNENHPHSAAQNALPKGVHASSITIALCPVKRGQLQKSIVDLMKLLKLDSGLAARKQLAQEFGYSGALDGSAEMNVWLHKQVMTKLAESGGQVPDSLKA